MIKQLELFGLIPVVTVDRAADALPLCRALAAGGLPLAEITFRTPAAEEAIALVHRELPQVLLGAGTVLTAEQADRAWAAGARFIVSPGFNPRLVAHCQDRGYPVLPGCMSPSDLEAALSMGLSAVKFFPAEAAGGVPMLKALAGPYPAMRFVPTGGINSRNLMAYLGLPSVLACGGSFMLPKAALAQQDWDTVTHLTRQAVDSMLGLELRHIGINHPDAGEAGKTAERLGQLLDLAPSRDSAQSCFVGEGFEVMKMMGRGEKAHLALAVNHLPRARFHLEQRGFQFDDSSLVTDAGGQPRLLYLREEIAGFAIHLLQKQEAP